MAADVHHRIRANSIKFLLLEAVTGFKTDGDLKVNFRSGRVLETDIAVVALDIVPETRLTSATKFETGVKDTIVIDVHMHISDLSIYAVGDAVRVRGFVSWIDAVLSLADLANRHSHIATDNIYGIPK